MSNRVGPVWTVVLAGGSGSRFGGPKHLVELRGRPILHWSLSAARQASDGVVLVLAEADVEAVVAKHPGVVALADRVVAGGASRSESVRSGLAAVPDDARIILIHDAARPLAEARLFDEVVNAVASGADGAVPALEVTDTIKVADRHVVRTTLDRESLVAVQTPQGFKADVIRKAHVSCGHESDDAALVEQLGFSVAVVAGDRHNLKVTVPEDLLIAEVLADRVVGAT